MFKNYERDIAELEMSRKEMGAQIWALRGDFARLYAYFGIEEVNQPSTILQKIKQTENK